jgi:hypothetical protein
MSTDPKTVAHSIQTGGSVSSEPMFGEQASNATARGLAWSARANLLAFGGRELANGAVAAPPYPGAEPCLIIEARRRHVANRFVSHYGGAMPPPEAKAKRPPNPG